MPTPARRLLPSSLLLGAVAGLLVGGIEAALVVAGAFGFFDGPLEVLRYVACALGLMLAAGAALGVAQGLIAWPLQALPARARAIAVAAAAAAPIALVATLAFAGPQAQKIPAHGALSAALILVGVVAVYVLARAAQAIAAGERGGRAQWIAAGAALVVAIAAEEIDLKVLPRLYPFFHLALEAIAVASAELALVLAFVLVRARRPSWERVRAPLPSLVTLLACALAGLGARSALSEARGLRTLALERSGGLQRLLKATAHKAAAPSLAATAPAPVALPPIPGPRLDAPDVVVITVDAMRADRLRPEVAPQLSRLAHDGVTFTRAYAQVPHTSFSIATLLTGKHVYSLSTLGLDAARHETLAQVMRRERYKTAAFYPPSVFFIDHERLRGLEESAYGFEYVKYEYLPADRRTDQIIDFFETEQPQRAFVWAHYLEPHEPYETHPGFTHGDSTRERYDGEIRFVDAQVARLVAWLQAHRGHVLVVVAADHGEEFGEHGGHYHGTTLYEEQVHVPLAFDLLGKRAGEEDVLASAEVTQPVGLVDVAPTLLALLGIERSLKMRGQDLSPLLSRETAPRFSRMRFQPQLAEIDRKKMITVGTDKLICDLETDSCQLYDLAADPGEQHDVAGVHAERAAALKARLSAWLADQARYEREARPSGPEAEAARTLERGRLGGRDAAPGLARLAAQTGARLEERREAAQLLARLPADPSLRPQLEEAARAGDEPLERWATVGLSRIGDAAAQARVRGFLLHACDDGAPTKVGGAEGAVSGGQALLCARAALALGDVDALSRAVKLPTLADDEALERELALALGKTHDARALDPLLADLAPVRTRKEVVQALGELGDRRAVPYLARWLPWDPYIGVRVEMARAIARLHDAESEPGLLAAAAREPEPQVMRALVDGLAELGAHAVMPADSAMAPAPGELWLTGDGAGTLEVTVGGQAARARMQAGVARVEVRAPGPVSVKRLDGDAQAARAFFRPPPPPP